MTVAPTAATRILENVVQALTEFEDNALPLDEFLDEHLTCPDLRRTVSSILFPLFRRRAELSAILNQLVTRPPKPFLRRVLLASLTQIYFSAGIAPQSAVNVAVSLVREKRGKQEAGFLNAVLRRAAQLQPAFSTQPEKVLPPALLKQWRKRFSAEEMQQLTTAFLTPAPNTFRCRRGEELSEQEVQNLEVTPVSDLGADALWSYYICGNPERILQHPDWSKGRFYFQDPATSGAMSLPDYSSVQRALDICAAPGGKALMAAEMLPPDAILIAADRSAKRQELTKENFQRCGFSHPVIVASPWEYTQEFGLFDLVIADVPCSNTGVFRKRPDALWRFRSTQQKQLFELQERLLTSAADRVAPNGQLLYSTCSIEPEENEKRIAQFLAIRPDFKLESELKQLPTPSHDGAYGCLLRRSALNI